uniref:Uncharacterized protein n=1 Tax=Oryza glumipatula TaxID=40148 RepID=A0A0E0BJF3_9ORYZ
MAAEAGIQLDSFSLGGPAEYPAGDGERDVLMVRFLRSITAFLANGTCQMQVNDGLRSVVDLTGGGGRGKSLQRLVSAVHRGTCTAVHPTV